MGPLIDAEVLEKRLDEVKVFDLRWSLTDPHHGYKTYAEGHIPGAVFVDLDSDLSAEEGDGRHPLPEIQDFTATLGRLGLEPGHEVVVYDDMAGAVAARMWWMLMSIGHTAAYVLDGGLRSWTDLGLPLESGDRHPVAAVYPPETDFTGVVRYDEIEERAVVDVRAPERYTGEIEPVDPKAGHIPGAINIPLRSNLDDRRRFRTGGDLAELFGEVAQEAVISCGSGVNACHTALAFTLAGRPMPDIYIGSFSDWSGRDLPVVQGTNP